MSEDMTRPTLATALPTPDVAICRRLIAMLRDGNACERSEAA